MVEIKGIIPDTATLADGRATTVVADFSASRLAESRSAESDEPEATSLKESDPPTEL